MNALTDTSPASSAPPRAGQADGGAEGSVTHTLRRTGRKAVRFEGWHLIEAVCPSDGREMWHDLNIYRTVKGTVVVELIVRRHLPDQQDIFHVKTFDDLPAAASWLETYRPGDDLPVPAGLGSPDLALPWAVLQSVQLRQRMDRIEADYWALLSEVFAALDLTDPAEPQLADAVRMSTPVAA
jgi:hypothetical protein